MVDKNDGIPSEVAGEFAPAPRGHITIMVDGKAIGRAILPKEGSPQVITDAPDLTPGFIDYSPRALTDYELNAVRSVSTQDSDFYFFKRRIYHSLGLNLDGGNGEQS